MVDSTGGGLVLFFGGIDKGSPRCEVLSAIYRWRRLRWLDATLRCCGPRRSVERGAHKCFFGVFMGVLGFAPPGPLLDE